MPVSELKLIFPFPAERVRLCTEALAGSTGVFMVMSPPFAVPENDMSEVSPLRVRIPLPLKEIGAFFVVIFVAADVPPMASVPVPP